jgi:Ca2+-binding EF-hand superfamily protein
MRWIFSQSGDRRSASGVAACKVLIQILRGKSMDMGNGFARNRKESGGAIDIESLKAGLRQLPPTRKPSKIGVLRELLEVIDEMLGEGVTYVDVADFLSEKTGLEFKADPLKSMLSKLRKEAQASEERQNYDSNNTGGSTEGIRTDASRNV